MSEGNNTPNQWREKEWGVWFQCWCVLNIFLGLMTISVTFSCFSFYLALFLCFSSGSLVPSQIDDLKQQLREKVKENNRQRQRLSTRIAAPKEKIIMFVQNVKHAHTDLYHTMTICVTCVCMQIAKLGESSADINRLQDLCRQLQVLSC